MNINKNILAALIMFILTSLLIVSVSNPSSSKSQESVSETCSINIRLLPVYEPLLLIQNNATNYLTAFCLPNTDRMLTFKGGEKINIACPGVNNYILIKGESTNTDINEAMCEHEDQFQVKGRSISLYDIICLKPPNAVARYNGNTCGNARTHKEIEIGFEVSGRFITHLLVCFDQLSQSSLYSFQNMSSSIAGFREGFKRPYFDEGNFYNIKPMSIDTLYRRNVQRRTVNGILSKPFLDDRSIIEDGDGIFLSKGHYCARADFFYFIQQALTFYYVNTAPQWSTFNNGNWNNMEQDCRQFASDRQLDLLVYTGSHGITTLSDIDQTLKELYLWVSQKQQTGISVPRFYYRVVYDPKSQSGVAFVGVNNPYLLDATQDVICEDVCDKITWISRWDRKNIIFGYFYCCEVYEFRKTVHVIPEFRVTSLLK